TVEVTGPRNHFELVSATEYLFVAGGVGIAPILPMILDAQRRGVPWRLVYGGRSHGTMAFLDDLARHGDAVTVWAETERGRIDVANGLEQTAPQVTVYGCGPEGLISAVECACAAAGRAAPRVERFRGAAGGPLPDDRPIDVMLRRSGRTLVVPAGLSILEVA